MNVKKILIALAILSLSAGMMPSSFAGQGNPNINDVTGLEELADWLYGTNGSNGNFYYCATATKININAAGPYYGNRDAGDELVGKILSANGYSYRYVTDIWAGNTFGIYHVWVSESGSKYNFIPYLAYKNDICWNPNPINAVVHVPF